jgi:hypothetical protein
VLFCKSRDTRREQRLGALSLLGLAPGGASGVRVCLSTRAGVLLEVRMIRLLRDRDESEWCCSRVKQCFGLILERWHGLFFSCW